MSRTAISFWLEAMPHLTLRRLKDLLAARGIAVSHDTVWRFLRLQGRFFKKKTACASEQHRPDVVRRRRRWQRAIGHLDPQRLVFIDETWIKTNMAPIRGWGIKGERLTGFAPDGRWRTLTFLAALRADALTAPVRHRRSDQRSHLPPLGRAGLLPELRPGDIVVLDNLGSHRAQAIRSAILAAGAKLAFLPPYSPDFNPIEQVFTKVKHWLRMAQARSIDAIHDNLARLISAIGARECANYFRNAGYTSS